MCLICKLAALLVEYFEVVFHEYLNRPNADLWIPGGCRGDAFFLARNKFHEKGAGNLV